MQEIKIKVNCFNLKDTLTCGQCFRWKEYKEENQYIGVIKDRVLKLKQEGDVLVLASNKEENLEEVTRRYLDLDTDYQKIEDEISTIDEKIKKAVELTKGIHILNQDFHETVVSYIISANNNIPRISKSIRVLSEKYGEEIEFEGEKYYLFPSDEILKQVTKEEYTACGVGFRDRYLENTVDKILNDKIDLSDINGLDNKELKKKLMTLMGIGSKVADCIMLFSLGRKDTFPIDVWVKRVMEELYFKRGASLKEIEEYSVANFGRYSGIVQQHLFHSIRNNLLDTKNM